MKTANVAERLLASTEWSSLGAMGSGEGVKRALGELLASEDGEAAQRAYWGIENHAFVQRELFEASEACTSVLIASLVDQREEWVRVAVLDLMFEILSGDASASAGTPGDIVERCHRIVREGLWLLHREATCGLRESALDVLDKLGEGDKARRLIDAGVESTVAKNSGGSPRGSAPAMVSPDEGSKLSSEDLAALIVDSLLWVGIVKHADFELAMEVVEEKIDIRKALGDY